MTAGDDEDIRLLISLVAANRQSPVSESVAAATRARLIALREDVGASAWRVAVGAAILAALNIPRPLRGQVYDYVADVARSIASSSARR